MSEDVAECAAAGARLLDEKAPDWAARINVERLDFNNTERCMLGQLYGSYVRGKRALGNSPAGELTYEEARGYGFICQGSAIFGTCTCSALKDPWTVEINRRLHQ
jgi:hypothetical protein